MGIVIPNAKRINRGLYVMQDSVSLNLNKNFPEIIILHEHSVPDGMILFYLPVGPTIYFSLKNFANNDDLISFIHHSYEK